MPRFIYINLYIIILMIFFSKEQRNNNNDNHTGNWNNNIGNENLEKKYENMIKKNIILKEKLKIYNLYFYIIESINIIFALIILSCIIHKLYKYYKSKKNTIIQIRQNNISSSVEINNNINSNKNQKIEIKDDNNFGDDKPAPPLSIIHT